jgi:putative MATE family efflux protein
LSRKLASLADQPVFFIKPDDARSLKEKTVTVEKDDDDKSPGSALRRDWTKGGITGNLASLAWPVIVSSTVMTMGPIVDTIWIGKLGSAAVAGVGVATIVVMLVNSLIMGLFTGLRALVARFVGAGETAMANHAAQQGLVIGMVFSLTVAAIGNFLAETILKLWNLQPDVVAIGGAYMRIALVGIFTMSFGMMAQNTMQASGDTRTPMIISISTRLFHIAFCPFLVFGWWVFPELGVRGAALSSVISQGFAGLIGLWVLFNGQTRLRLTLKNFGLDWDIIWRMVKIGIPASINGLHTNLGNVVYMWFISPFGTLAVAGHHIVARLDMFVVMPAMGLGMAAGILAAQNLGAGQPQRSEKTVWTAVIWLAGFMVIFTAAVYVWAENIVRIFNNEPEMVDIATKFLRIQAASYLCNGLAMIIMNVLNNVGDTLRAMIIDMTNLWGVRLLLAFWLPKITTLGVYGVRWAIVADALSSAIMFVIYLKIGNWKRKRV